MSIKKTINGKEVKITRVGRLYVDGKLVMTLSDGQPICDRITPFNLPDRAEVGVQVWELAHDWASKHYTLCEPPGNFRW